MMYVYVVTIILLFCTILYLYLRNSYNYWKNKGVATPPTSLIFGNFKDVIFMRKSLGELYGDFYRAFPKLAAVGIYRTSPALLIRDPELIEEILIKQFSSFRDNDVYVDEKIDEMFGNNPFVLKGDKWKKYRNYLTPCFTHPKMKNVFNSLTTNAEKLVKFISEQEDATNVKTGLEAKRFFELFTAEVVANVAFGIDGRSFEEENVEFKQMAREIVEPNFWNAFKFSCFTIIPQLAQVFGVGFASKHIQERLLQILSDAIKHRRKNKIVRNDFVDIFDSTITKNNLDLKHACMFACSFFIDAFETSAEAMTFASYELSVNPEVQSELREEINKIFDKYNNELTYEAVVNEMPYMDAVLNETLRKYAPLPFLAKTCTKPCTLESKNEELVNFKVDITEGSVVIIPLLGLHLDAKHFPDPKSFNPERFLKENSENIKKFTFLPFGEGPRVCIGKSFGLLQTKVALAYLIKNFEIVLNNKTKTPLEIEPLIFLMAIKGGFWANLYKIKIF